MKEELYDPALPEEERGKGAWDRTKPKRTSLGKRSRGDSTTSLEGSKRKLRRTASTKLSTQNDGLWGDIVGGGAVAQVSRSGIWEVDDSDSLPQNGPTKPKIPVDNPKNGSLQSTIENPPRKRGMAKLLIRDSNGVTEHLSLSLRFPCNDFSRCSRTGGQDGVFYSCG